MLNKILYAARVAKGLTTAELARQLGMTEAAYEEVESGIVELEITLALKLADYFSIEAEFFLAGEIPTGDTLKKALEQQRELLHSIEAPTSESGAHLSIARLGIEAYIALHEKYILLQKQKILENEIKTLKKLYLGQKSGKPPSDNR